MPQSTGYSKDFSLGSKGGHPKFFMNVYKAVIMPKLDYG